MNCTLSRRGGFLTRLILACFGAAFLSAPMAAVAGDQVPFSAGFTTQHTDQFVPPFYLQVTVTGQGNASHMGRTAAFTNDQLVNLQDGTGTATYTLTAANGDTLVMIITARTTNIPGGVSFEGDYNVTGGTGRFVGATGTGVIAGSAFFTSPNGGPGSFTLAGTISSPGQAN